jgi:eukaryotic-like serine/threonine-protein kinase
MSFAGTRLGPYEIVSLLGAGGMGEVYRARDTKLGRDVAIKILPAAFAADPDRLARFEREARVLASLNHPHIAQIYGVEESGGVTALVLEFVEGETLAARLKASRSFGLKETLAIARQIADALDAAHERGIVHRDLKPANVVITPDGTVKVLDFGLATERSASLSGERNELTHSPTVMRPTIDGVLLGTAPYMSPEQARGKAVDKRTDIWAFGCVLYEMLTGHPAFTGETTSDVVAAILEREPDWSTLPAAVPQSVRRVIERCLDKNPKRRLRDIGDARLDPDMLSDVDQPSASDASSARGTRSAIALLTIAVVLVAGYALFEPVERPGEFTFAPIAALSVEERSPAWSPDGRNIAYVADTDSMPQIFVTSLAARVPQRVTNVPGGATNPIFSRDGTRLFFSSRGDLWSVGAAGGEPVLTIKDVAGATVARDGSLAFVRGVGGNQTLWLRPRGVDVPTQYVTASFPRTFTRASGIQFSSDGARIAVLVELQDDTRFRHQLWIVPFPSGTPRMMPDRERLGPGRDFPSRRLSWEPDNRHVVVANEEAGHGLHLFRVDTDNGDVEAITSGVGEETTPAVSPDGRSIAYASGGTDFDIVEIAADSGRSRPLLATPRSERYPLWLRGTSRYAYITDMRGSHEIWLQSEGEYWPTPIVTAGAEALPRWLSLERPSISPDGRRIAYGVTFRDRHVIWISPVAGGVPVPLDEPSIDHHGAAWSPDGNWLAYQRLSGTKWNLVKRPVGPGAAVALAESPPGAGSTSWSPTGEWIAFADSAGLHAVSPDGSQNKVVSRSEVATFEFMPDGKHIVAVRRRPDRMWELATIDIATTAETSVRLDIPPTALVSGLSVHPTERRIAVAVGTSKFDLWLLEGYRMPHARFRFLSWLRP